MSNEQLKQSLIAIHEQLSNTSEVDEEMAALVAQLNRDIHLSLDKAAQQDEPLSTLSDRTLELSARLAAQSPHLEAGLRELGNILLRMGL